MHGNNESQVSNRRQQDMADSVAHQVWGNFAEIAFCLGAVLDKWPYGIQGPT